MRRTFLVNILFLLLVNVLVKPIYLFGIDRSVQNEVGPEIYGLYFSLINFTYILQFFADLGINNFNVRHIAQNTHLTRKYFSRLLSIKILLSFLYFIVVLIIAWIISYHHVITLLILVALNQILSSIMFYVRSHVSGLGWYRWDSILSITDKMLMIIICSYLLWGAEYSTKFSIEWFVLAQIASFAMAIIFGLVLLRGEIMPLRFSFRVPFSLAILRKSLPFALAVLLMTAYTRIDAVMLERLLEDGQYQTGLYAGTYRILDAVNVIGFLFASLLYPMFSKLLKSGKSVQNLSALAFRILITISACIVVPVSIYSQEIMDVLYIESDLFWGYTMQVLIFTLVPLSTLSVFGTLLTANDNLMQMNKIFIFGICINIALNLLLIFRYGALGAAIATLVTQTCILLPHLYLVKNRIGMALPYTSFMKALILLFLGLGAAFLLKNNLMLNTWITFAISVTFVWFLALLLKLVDIKSFRMLILTDSDD